MKDIRDYIEKLWDLEIFVSLAKFDWEEGYKKRYSNLTEVKKDNVDSIDFGLYDLLIINLLKSNLICLDIEGHPNSVTEFYQFLESERIDIRSLPMERSMNNGLHIYFRNTPYIKPEPWNGMGNIHYDIINKRAFTFPSSFDGKGYAWMHNSFENIKKRDDIPTTPLWISYMLSKSTKYFKPGQK